MMKRTLMTTSILASLVSAGVGCERTDDTSGVITNRAAVSQEPLAAHLPAALSSSFRKRPARGAGASAPRTVAAAPDTASQIPAKYKAFAAAFDFERTTMGVPGAAVALIEHGQVTFTHGFGTAGPNSTHPVDAETTFRLGPATMGLTAAAELALIDHGKAKLSDSITTLVPKVALTGANASLLTARDLLSSQSGLFDFTTLSANPALATLTCPTDPSSLSSFVTGALFGQNELFMNRPGLFYTSSNPNFILAGAAIEHETGAFFPTAMKDVLFQPLGMTRTFFLPSDVTTAGNYSNGLSRNPDGTPWDVAPDAYDCAAYRPYGYAFSTASDYAKFARFLLEGNPQILSDASRVAMQSGQVGTEDFGEITSEGYGLTVQTGYVSPSNVYYPTKTVSSVGGLPGFTSVLYFFPETDFGFVALANADNASFVASLDAAVQSFAGLPKPTPLPASANAVPGDFARYAGVYRDPTGQLGTIIVADRGQGALTIHFADAKALGFTFYPQLSPVFRESFLVMLSGSPTPIAFIQDSEGRYSHLLIADLIPAARLL